MNWRILLHTPLDIPRHVLRGVVLLRRTWREIVPSQTSIVLVERCTKDDIRSLSWRFHMKIPA